MWADLDLRFSSTEKKQKSPESEKNLYDDKNMAVVTKRAAPLQSPTLKGQSSCIQRVKHRHGSRTSLKQHTIQHSLLDSWKKEKW